MNYVTAGQACKYFQISYMTLKRWRQTGLLKCKVLTDRKILYDIDSLNNDTDDDRMNVIYARVTTSSQKSQLESQISLIKSYMIANGVRPDAVYSEIASGLNDNRNELNKLISDIINQKIKSVYISYKDRLTRFGFGYFKSICQICNVELVVIDNIENADKTVQQELAEDLISVVHHYSTKLYSNRRKQLNEIKKILETSDDK